jgi:hypothetical protein
MDDRKNIIAVIGVLLTVLALIIIADWYIVCGFKVSNIKFVGLLSKFHSKIVLIRFFFVAVYALSIWMMPARVRIKDETTKYILLLSAVILGILIILGTISVGIYDVIIYPLIFFGYLLLAVLAISAFKSKVFSDDSIFGISCEDSDFFFEFNTEGGLLRIHKPQQNIWIDAGTGGGKSDTFIKSIIRQSAERNYAGFVYDWEGDPTKDNSPLLSKVAYGCIEHYKRKGLCKMNFAFINFTDMTRTVRVNVFSEKYVPKGNESLFIRNIASTLLKNLEKSWKEKTDFWANNAINYVYSVAYKCYKERDKKLNTLPHVIAICLNDSDAVFKWLSEDNEISLNMSSMITAWKMGAAQQTAGAVSSAQTPLVNLNNKNIFWVLSGTEESEFDLDITNRDNPTLLCIGNAPDLKDAVTPSISCIGSVLMMKMNQPGKNKSIFLVDELPTVNFQNLEVFTSTARKHNVSTILSLQDFSQAERDLGKDSAKILRTTCSNQNFGQTGKLETAKEVQDMLGEIDMVSDSYTTQDTGSGSETESLKKEKVMLARDIMGQPTGHYVGKIANGKPPYYSVQFDMDIGYSEDIPPFSLIVSTGDKNKDIEVMDKIVEANYQKILTEVAELLKPYQS